MIGAGIWSEVQLSAWRDVRGGEIVALCDVDEARLRTLAAGNGIVHTYLNAEEMLHREDLDFVDICTRPASHDTLTRLAARRQLPVLCQKPFCRSLEEARNVVEFCGAQGAPLMINENFRWQAWHRKINQLLQERVVGEPFVAQIHRRLRVSLPDFRHRQKYMQEMPHWAVYEMGVHYLDVFRFLFGEPSSVYCRLHKISPHVQGEDVQIIVLGYQDLTCVVTHSYASVPVPEIDLRPDDEDSWNITNPFEIDGTDATLALNTDGSLHLYSDGKHLHWEFGNNALHSSRVTTLQHFIDQLDEGKSFETSGEDNLKTMALVYAAYDSAATGLPIAVGDTNKEEDEPWNSQIS